MKLKFIKIEDIDLGDRFRKEYDEIGELAYSIKTKGLITPIAVGFNPESTEHSGRFDGKPQWLLAAGGRRIKAIQYLINECRKREIPNALDAVGIPARVYDRVLTELEYRSIELAENMDRDDLKYYERIAIVRNIHRLQLEIHGEKIAKDPNAPGWSQADTAAMLGRSTSQIADDLRLAKGIEDFPKLELTQCTNKTEALKRLKKFGEVFVTHTKAKEFEEHINNLTKPAVDIDPAKEGDPTTVVVDTPIDPKQAIIKDLMTNYILNDFFEGVKEMPDNSVNLIEVDPPYGVDLRNTKAGDTYGYNEIPRKDYPRFLYRVFKECYRVAAQDSWIIVWFAPDPWVNVVSKLLRAVGFSTSLNFGSWYKAGSLEDTSSGQNLQPKWKLANCYELFMYGWKGRPELGKPGATNGFPYKPISPSSKTHPTERPLELMVDILQTFGRAGDRVLVPFLGSGNTLISAHACKMYGKGFELSKMYKEAYTVKLFNLFK